MLIRRIPLSCKERGRDIPSRFLKPYFRFLYLYYIRDFPSQLCRLRSISVVYAEIGVLAQKNPGAHLSVRRGFYKFWLLIRLLSAFQSQHQYPAAAKERQHDPHKHMAAVAGFGDVGSRGENFYRRFFITADSTFFML